MTCRSLGIPPRSRLPSTPEDWLAHCEALAGRTRPTLPALCVQTVVPTHLHAVCERFGMEPDDFTRAGHPFVTFRYRDREVVLGASAKGSYAAGAPGRADRARGKIDRSLGWRGVARRARGGRRLRRSDEGPERRGRVISLRAPESVRLSVVGADSSAGGSPRGEGLPGRAHFGPVWTTTAHFRQTVARVKAFRAEGCLAVNNEAAGAFAVGRHRQVEVASLLRIGDTLAEDRFTVPPRGRVRPDE